MRYTDDAALVHAAQATPAAFGALYERYHPMIFRYALRCTHDRMQAEDIAAETFLRAMRALGRYEERGMPFSAWLFRIATNQLIQQSRRGRGITFQPLDIGQAGEGSYALAADQQEHPLDPQFHGWGRTGTDFRTGVWSFETVKPGAVTGRHGRSMAPHVNLWLASRGMNIGLSTRMYFPDEAEANAGDPVLALAGPLRHTLVARHETRDGLPTYVFDIHLQGLQETVFLDI